MHRFSQMNACMNYKQRKHVTLYRKDVFEGRDVNKTSASKECDIFDYWYFLNYCFTYQLNVCNRCHDLLLMSLNLINVVGSDYCCIMLI